MVASIGDDNDNSDKKLPAKETMMDVSQTQRLMPQMNDNSGDESAKSLDEELEAPEMLGAVHRTDHVTLFVKSLIANKSKAELANMGADIIDWTNLFKDGAVDINVFDTRSRIPKVEPLGFLYVTGDCKVSLVHSICSTALRDPNHFWDSRIIGLVPCPSNLNGRPGMLIIDRELVVQLLHETKNCYAVSMRSLQTNRGLVDAHHGDVKAILIGCPHYAPVPTQLVEEVLRGGN